MQAFNSDDDDIDAEDVKSENAEKLSSTQAALSVLSEALEVNKQSDELWVHFLQLFATVAAEEELRDLCYQAVMLVIIPRPRDNFC